MCLRVNIWRLPCNQARTTNPALAFYKQTECMSSNSLYIDNGQTIVTNYGQTSLIKTALKVYSQFLYSSRFDG